MGILEPVKVDEEEGYEKVEMKETEKQIDSTNTPAVKPFSKLDPGPCNFHIKSHRS